MIQVLFATKSDIFLAKKKLLTLHEILETPCEKDTIADFATCLKQRLRPCIALDFLEICEKSADDLSDPEKVPETYEQFTIGRLKDMTTIFAKELFGTQFAREVQDFIESKELV